MSIHNAKKFIHRIEHDKELRYALLQATAADERQEVLARIGLEFTDYEYEEAFRNLLASCQFAEQAAVLQELFQWWQVLSSS